MASSQLPNIEVLRELFSYDPVEGVVRWRRRPRDHFRSDWQWANWNRRWEDTPGTIHDGYVLFRISNFGEIIRCLGHQIAYALTTGRTDFGVLDHKDGNRSNNVFTNLRPATHAQNMANRSARKNSTLLKGVRFVDGFYYGFKGRKARPQYEGPYLTEQEAHDAYCDYAKTRWGEFFRAG